MKGIASVFGLVAVFCLVHAPAAHADEVTVTGCLEKGDEKDEFELTNASGGDADEYELIAGEGVDLGPHVGHKVELEGTLASEADEEGGGEKKEAAHAHLKVSSMKHLAAECP